MGLVDGITGQTFDATRTHCVHGVAGHRLIAQVRDRHHLYARIEQIECDTVGVGVGGQHHRATRRLHRIAVNQALHRRAEHHAGQVVVAKHCGLLKRPAGHHRGAGAQLGHTLAIDQRDPLIGIPRRRQSAGEQADLRVSSDALPQLQRGIALRDMAAKLV